MRRQFYRQKKNFRLNTNNKSTAGKGQRANYLKSRRSDCMTNAARIVEKKNLCVMKTNNATGEPSQPRFSVFEKDKGVE
jgi:hypothetical protein